MSLWAAEQAFSWRFCHRWRSTPGSCRAWMRRAGFGPSWWLTDFRAAWAVWRHISCLSNCQGCSEMQRFRATGHQNDGAKRAGRGRGSVLRQGGWSSAGAVLEMEKTGWKGAWHVVQGTAMTKGGGGGVQQVAEAPSPVGKCLGSVTSLRGNAASVGHVAVCRASLKMGSHPFCS